MILYLDTSALVKLYVEEPGSIEVAAALDLRLAGGDIEFSSFDKRQNRAAQRERLRMTVR